MLPQGGGLHPCKPFHFQNWPRSGAMWRLPRLKGAAGLRGFAARARGVLVLWDERRGFGKAGLTGLALAVGTFSMAVRCFSQVTGDLPDYWRV